MKRVIEACVVFVFFGITVLLLIGCRDKGRGISLADLDKHPAFEATVDRLGAGRPPYTNMSPDGDDVFILVRTQSGEKFSIGNFLSEHDSMAGFARTLQKGKSYEFPRVWLEYKARIGQGTNRAEGH